MTEFVTAGLACMAPPGGLLALYGEATLILSRYKGRRGTPGVIFGFPMKKNVFAGLLCAVAVLSVNVWSQTRRHDEIMKDVNATYEKLKKSLDAQKDKEAFEDALKLQKLFKEVEDFWTPFDTKDAIEAARRAQNSFAALSRSVQVNNFQQAVMTYNTAAQFCRDCHSVHRIQAADKSYLIKP